MSIKNSTAEPRPGNEPQRHPSIEKSSFLREIFVSSPIPGCSESDVEFPLIYKSKSVITLVHKMSRSKLREMAVALQEVELELDQESTGRANEDVLPSSSDSSQAVNKNEGEKSHLDLSVDEVGEVAVEESCSPAESEAAVSPEEIIFEVVDEENTFRQQLAPEKEEDGVTEDITNEDEDSSSEDIANYEEQLLEVLSETVDSGSSEASESVERPALENSSIEKTEAEVDEDSVSFSNDGMLDAHSGEDKKETGIVDDASSDASERDVSETMFEKNAGENYDNSSGDGVSEYVNIPDFETGISKISYEHAASSKSIIVSLSLKGLKIKMLTDKSKESEVVDSESHITEMSVIEKTSEKNTEESDDSRLVEEPLEYNITPGSEAESSKDNLEQSALPESMEHSFSLNGTMIKMHSDESKDKTEMVDNESPPDTKRNVDETLCENNTTECDDNRSKDQSFENIKIPDSVTQDFETRTSKVNPDQRALSENMEDSLILNNNETILETPSEGEEETEIIKNLSSTDNERSFSETMNLWRSLENNSPDSESETSKVKTEPATLLRSMNDSDHLDKNETVLEVNSDEGGEETEMDDNACSIVTEKDATETMSEQNAGDNDKNKSVEGSLEKDISDSEIEVPKSFSISKRSKDRKSLEYDSQEEEPNSTEMSALESPSKMDTETEVAEDSDSPKNNGMLETRSEEGKIEATIDEIASSSSAERNVAETLSEENTGANDGKTSVDESLENNIPDSEAGTSKLSSISESTRSKNGVDEIDAAPTRLRRKIAVEELSNQVNAENVLLSKGMKSHFSLKDKEIMLKTNSDKIKEEMVLVDNTSSTATLKDVAETMSDDNRSVGGSLENDKEPDSEAETSKSPSIPKRTRGSKSETDEIVTASTGLGKKNIVPELSKKVNPENVVVSKNVKNSTTVGNNGTTLETHSDKVKEETVSVDSTSTSENVTETMSENTEESDDNGSVEGSLDNVKKPVSEVRSTKSSSTSKRTRGARNGTDEVDAAPTRLRRKNVPDLSKEVIPEHDILSKSAKSLKPRISIAVGEKLPCPSPRTTRSKSVDPSPQNVHPSLRDLKTKTLSTESPSSSSTRMRRAKTPDIKLKSDIKVAVRSSPRKPPRAPTAVADSSSAGSSTTTSRNGVASRTSTNLPRSNSDSVNTRRTKRT